MTLGQGIEASLIIDVAFWVISVSTIVAAVAVVQLRDLFRAALFLIVAFLGVAGLFVLLRAEFLGAVQVLIYVGAVSVLIIFAILMTRDVEEGSPYNPARVPVGIVVALFATAAIYVAIDTDWLLLDTAMTDAHLSETIVDEIGTVFSNTIPQIGRLFIREFVVAFEIASVLLLAAIIGALALVRER